MMKALQLTLILILTTTINGLSQSFSLSELINLNYYNTDKFDTYVIQKGYRYYQNTNTDFANGNSYVLVDRYDNKVAYISKYKIKQSPEKMISFQTKNTSTYIRIKNELKSQGFRYTRSLENDDTHFLYYTKGNIEIALASGTQEREFSDTPLTTYEISVTIKE